MEYDTRIALIYQQQPRKANVKKQRSDPRHAPPHLGSPGAATMQLVAFAALKKEQQHKDAQGEHEESPDKVQR